jgi:hypothetical protein
MWQGVFPAVTTKMREDGAIDLAATGASIERLIDNGVSGVIVLPMLGENASLSPDRSARASSVPPSLPRTAGCPGAVRPGRDHARQREEACPRLSGFRRRRA